jgi:hypothetical protein
MTVLRPASLLALLATLALHPLSARDLLIDQRGGADFKTLASAAAAARAGDTLIIAKGSGPYREPLSINQPGTSAAPITVEGNGETITGFSTLTGFYREDDAGPWLVRLPHAFPVVLTFQGRRILQDQATGQLLGPVRLRPDAVTLELSADTPIEGWEVSTRQNVVRIRDVSHHVYRNIVATGSLNDGFNLHGTGSGLRFENIVGAQNLDEGFSAHDTINCEISGGDFWGNDNGLTNIGRSALRARDLKCHDNIGFGFFLSSQARGELSHVDSWGNGVSQIRFEPRTSGTCENVRAWAMPSTNRPWVSHQEAAPTIATAALANAAANPDPERWTGRPALVSSPAPVSGQLVQMLPPEHTSPADELNTLIQTAITSGQPSLRLPAGTIRLDQTIEIKRAKNLEIDGTGTTLVMTGATQSTLRIKDCDGLTLRGLTLDYDPLPFTQGVITRADARTVEFTVDEGYPDLDADYKGATYFFTPDGKRHSSFADFYKSSRFDVVSPRKGRAHFGENLPAIPSAGDLMVVDRRHMPGVASAVEIRGNTGPVSIREVTMRASPSIAFVGRYGEGLVTFDHVTIRPGPPPTNATRPRLLSTNADGINFAQSRVGPLVENCDFSGMGDDSFNVHGFLFPVMRVLSPTRLLIAYKYGAGSFTRPIRAGDTVRLHSEGAFAIVGRSALSAFTPLDSPGDITAAEFRALFPTYRSDSYTVYRVDLTSPLDARPGQWIDLPALNCPGYVVRENYFHDHRGRGLRIMGDDGLVENNRFERITKSAISVGPEIAYWREAGWVENLVIRGNTLRDIGTDISLAAANSYVPGAIGIFVRTDRPLPPHPNENRHIVIENNRVENCSVAGIHAYAARDLVIRGNTLVRTNLTRGTGTEPSNGLVTNGPISVSAAENVTQKDNTILKP